MPTGPEARVWNQIRKVVKKIPGMHCYKTFGGPHGSGQPDVIGCIRGQMFAVELKKPNATSRVSMKEWENAPARDQEWLRMGATPNQVAKLKEWERAGALVGVASSVRSFGDIIRRYINPSDWETFFEKKT